MPESKGRHPHHAHQQNHPVQKNSKSKKANRAVIVAILFFGLLGMGISYFIDPESTPALIGGALMGAIAGYFFGHQIDKSLNKK